MMVTTGKKVMQLALAVRLLVCGVTSSVGMATLSAGETEYD